jgi:hypothetical protein
MEAHFHETLSRNLDYFVSTLFGSAWLSGAIDQGMQIQSGSGGD